MKFTSFYPKKFSSRLFIMTCVAGLIPVMVFLIVLKLYGGQFRGEIIDTIQQASGAQASTVEYLTVTINRLIESFRVVAFLFMGLGILAISLLAAGIGMYFSRSIVQLREATRRVNEGDFGVRVKASMSGEVGILTGDFNRMVAQLSATTVSKQLLEKSEERLRETNLELLREIDARKRIEEALAGEKECLDVTLRSLSDGVIASGADGKVLLINSVAERLTGWQQQEAIGLELNEVFHVDEVAPADAENRGETESRFGREERGARSNREVLIARDGARRIITETRSPMSDRDGEVLGTVLIFRDITFELMIEKELVRVWKDISISAAHKIGNPIFAIETDLDSLQKRIREGREGEAMEVVANIRSAVEKAKIFVGQFKSLAKAQEVTLIRTRLYPILEDACRIAINQDVECSIGCPHDVEVKGDPDRLAECFDELIMNATRWTDKYPRKIRISVENPAPEPLPDALDTAKTYLAVHIVDNGIGIADSDKDRIFDMFYTRQEHGTGLGLPIVRRALAAHGGYIIESGLLGEGADFIVYLPLINQSVSMQEASS